MRIDLSSMKIYKCERSDTEKYLVTASRLVRSHFHTYRASIRYFELFLDIFLKIDSVGSLDSKIGESLGIIFYFTPRHGRNVISPRGKTCPCNRLAATLI